MDSQRRLADAIFNQNLFLDTERESMVKVSSMIHDALEDSEDTHLIRLELGVFMEPITGIPYVNYSLDQLAAFMGNFTDSIVSAQFIIFTDTLPYRKTIHISPRFVSSYPHFALLLRSHLKVPADTYIGNRPWGPNRLVRLEDE